MGLALGRERHDDNVDRAQVVECALCIVVYPL